MFSRRQQQRQQLHQDLQERQLMHQIFPALVDSFVISIDIGGELYKTQQKQYKAIEEAVVDLSEATIQCAFSRSKI